MRLFRVFALVVCLWPLAAAVPAAAHPLGNFTINHLAKFSAARGELRVRYVLDIAEIPTFQIMHAQSSPWSGAVMQRWANDERGVVKSGLHVSAGGVPLMLNALSAHAMLRPGAGGLPIIRWVGEFIAPLPAQRAQHVTGIDRVYADRRIGWKDIIAGTQSEPTNELRHYPSALIGTPRRVNAVSFTVLPSGVIQNVSERSDDTPQSGSISAWISPTALSDMFARSDRTPLYTLLVLLAAFGLGALHAVEPGHGKALLAFTLVGARATTKQALILAGSLTVAHTSGVLLLGVVLFFASSFVSESIYPWITLLSGAAIAVIGARSLARYVRMRRGLQHQHPHVHDGANHGHSHALPGSSPLNFRSAVLAAMSGGIAPCPAAIVVLLAALRLHQVGFGVLVIVIFSMGLAGVLSGLGIGVVHGAAWLSRQSGYNRIAQFGPLITALVISAIGAWTLASGFSQQGVAAPVPLIAAIALAAIAGYAMSAHGHEHVHSHAEAVS